MNLRLISPTITCDVASFNGLNNHNSMNELLSNNLSFILWSQIRLLNCALNLISKHGLATPKINGRISQKSDIPSLNRNQFQNVGSKNWLTWPITWLRMVNSVLIFWYLFWLTTFAVIFILQGVTEQNSIPTGLEIVFYL